MTIHPIENRSSASGTIQTPESTKATGNAPYLHPLTPAEESSDVRVPTIFTEDQNCGGYSESIEPLPALTLFEHDRCLIQANALPISTAPNSAASCVPLCVACQARESHLLRRVVSVFNQRTMKREFKILLEFHSEFTADSDFRCSPANRGPGDAAEACPARQRKSERRFP